MKTEGGEALGSSEKLVMSVPEAGKLIGKGRNKAYELARRGVFPVIVLDGRMVVPKLRFLQWLNGSTPGSFQVVEENDTKKEETRDGDE